MAAYKYITSQPPVQPAGDVGGSNKALRGAPLVGHDAVPDTEARMLPFPSSSLLLPGRRRYHQHGGGKAAIYTNPNLHNSGETKLKGRGGASRRRARASSAVHNNKVEQQHHHRRVLDGFLLLEVCRVEFPDEAVVADMHDMGLQEVVAEDLPYFSQLQVVDAGVNSLGLADMVALPALTHLRLHCNGISDISPCAQLKRLDCLQVLDLSYNRLSSSSSVASLCRLPSLRDLDLSGNRLGSLPHDLSGFLHLERLVLSHNLLAEAAHVFPPIASAPALRIVILAHNCIKEVGESALDPSGGGGVVESLDLAYNHIEREDALLPLLYMRKLKELLLYGNPMTGPSGEDLTGASVAQLGAVARQVREGWVSPDEEPLRLITDKPRKRGSTSSKNNNSQQHRQQQAAPPTTTPAGPATSASSSSQQPQRPPMLLLQQSPGGGVVWPSSAHAGGSRAGNPYRGVALTTIDPLTSSATTGMPSAAEFRAAGNEVLFTSLVDLAEEKPTYTHRLATSQEDEEDDVRRTFITGLHTVEDHHAHEDEEGGQEEEEEDQHMPKMFTRRPFLASSGGNPGRLRSALSALRFALKHHDLLPMPASDHHPTTHNNNKDESKGGNKGGGHGRGPVDRPNASTLARRMPKKTYTAVKAPSGTSTSAANANKGLPTTTTTSLSSSVRQLRGSNLRTLEEVLDSMNQHMASAVDDDSDVLHHSHHHGGGSGGGGGGVRAFGMKRLIQLVNDFVAELEVPRPPPGFAMTTTATNHVGQTAGGGGGGAVLGLTSTSSSRVQPSSSSILMVGVTTTTTASNSGPGGGSSSQASVSSSKGGGSKGGGLIASNSSSASTASSSRNSGSQSKSQGGQAAVAGSPPQQH